MGGRNQTEKYLGSKEISIDTKNSSQVGVSHNAGITQLEKSLGFIFLNKTENYTGRIQHISMVSLNTLVCFENFEQVFWCSGEDLTKDYKVGDLVYIDYKVIVALSSKQYWITSIEMKKEQNQ